MIFTLYSAWSSRVTDLCPQNLLLTIIVLVVFEPPASSIFLADALLPEKIPQKSYFTTKKFIFPPDFSKPQETSKNNQKELLEMLLNLQLLACPRYLTSRPSLYFLKVNYFIYFVLTRWWTKGVYALLGDRRKEWMS